MEIHHETESLDATAYEIVLNYHRTSAESRKQYYDALLQHLLSQRMPRSTAYAYAGAATKLRLLSRQLDDLRDSRTISYLAPGDSDLEIVPSGHVRDERIADELSQLEFRRDFDASNASIGEICDKARFPLCLFLCARVLVNIFLSLQAILVFACSLPNAFMWVNRDFS
jgi:hypothetical protein